jgi:hypothetical protein
MNLDTQQRKIVNDLMIKYNLSEKEVIEIIESPFIFIRQTIKELDVEDIKTEEEFNNKIKNFNIPSIGKLHGSYYNYKNIQKCKKT